MMSCLEMSSLELHQPRLQFAESVCGETNGTSQRQRRVSPPSSLMVVNFKFKARQTQISNQAVAIIPGFCLGHDDELMNLVDHCLSSIDFKLE
jgi:hypothetical protein